MTVPRPVRSDSPAVAQPEAKGKRGPGSSGPGRDEVGAGGDSQLAVDSASAATRVMKQTSKTPAEGGDRR